MSNAGLKSNLKTYLFRKHSVRRRERGLFERRSINITIRLGFLFSVDMGVLRVMDRALFGFGNMFSNTLRQYTANIVPQQHSIYVNALTIRNIPTWSHM